MVYAVLIVIFAVVAIISAFLIVGVRVQGYFDLAAGTFVTDAFVFGKIHLLRYRIFECSGDFYSQVNSRELKKIRIKSGEKDTKGAKTTDNGKLKIDMRVAEKIGAVVNAVCDLKGIRLKKLRAYLTVGTCDSMSTSIAAAALASALAVLNAATYDKIKVKESDVAVYPNFRYENTVFTFDVETGMGTAGLALRFLKTGKALKSVSQL